jgi:hypothetical protein
MTRYFGPRTNANRDHAMPGLLPWAMGVRPKNVYKKKIVIIK